MTPATPGARLVVLDPASPHAQGLADLFLVFTIVCAIVWALVVLGLAAAALRRRRKDPRPQPHPDPARERRLLVAVAAATVATVLILVGLNAASIATDVALSRAEGEPRLTIEVTGHQWWWEVTYEDPQPSRRLTTANEIHIPVGEPVLLKLGSTDVIHSFWVPELAGKKDLIPGLENTLVIRADRAGEFSGQCAEFCGYQHAHMRFKVFAEPRAAFEAWRERQLQPAATPAPGPARQGLDVFLAGPCAMCHTIRGTPAGGKVAPDLTHLASRTTIAAGTLAHTRGNLAAWIADAQGVKPGALMPSMELTPQELHLLLDYLETLR